ncbi:PAS domain S-box protein [Stappia sp. F7233]|uniref:histidine kinase n=1 Tax=Stappia albiluteola TaxID=2758565 RepID=A0A839AEU1_9HYPH|nr:ATP-binding protein [Stappia albiluteola]MBA5778340.1 PAS domain S-box protein [Stappia albiluteola]
MDSLTRGYLALSGLAAANSLLGDPRPAWIWAGDGQSILWANAAGAAFFGVEALEDLAAISGLARAPARPHIARIAQSGSADRDTIDRLRFYRGLRVLILTCLCRRLILPDGMKGALIVATDMPRTGQEPAPLDALCRFVAGRTNTAWRIGPGGTALGSHGPLDLPDREEIASLSASGKRSPVFGTLPVADGRHEAALVALDEGESLLVVSGNAAKDETHPSEPAFKPAPQQPVDEPQTLAGEPDAEDAAEEKHVEDEAEFARLTEEVGGEAPAEPERASGTAGDDGEIIAPPHSDFEFEAAGRPVRFAWKMDIDRRFTFLSPEFEQVMGPAAADIVGETWSDVARRFGLDEDGRIASALGRRDTWSGRTVNWPVTGKALRVPVDMAALPAFDRRRVFEGFRGFGVCRAADAFPDPEGEVVAVEHFNAPAAEPDEATEPVEAGEIAEARSGTDEPAAEAVTEVEEATGIGKAFAETAEEPTVEEQAAEAGAPDEGVEVGEPFEEAADQAASIAEDAEASRLSRPEREAFRKIAEALGGNSVEDAAAAPDTEKVVPEPEGEADEAESPKDIEAADSKVTQLFAGKRARGAAPEPVAEPAVLEGGAELEAYDEAARRARQPDAAARKSGPPTAIEPAILDRLPIGVAIIRDPDLLYANDTLIDLLGYEDIAELRAAGGLDAVFGEPEEWPSANGDPVEVERTMRVRLAGGGLRPVKARLHAVPWNGGRALMISFLDRHDPIHEAAVDSLHVAQTALGEAEEQIAELDAVLETATDGVLVLDDKGTILKVNRSAEALFSSAREEMVGAPLAHYLAPESHRSAADYLEGLARNGVASVLNDGREVIGRVRSGGLIPLFMTIGRVGSDPDAPKFCAVLRDITQWKTAEEELTHAKKQAETASSQKSDFLAKISHEIRTPLNAIIGFSEVMMEERFGPIGNDRYKEYLRDIHKSGSHLMSLINDLLDLSKIEAGKLDLTFEAVSANDIIRECVALMQPQANRDRVIIRASLPASVPNIVADGRSVRQIVLNLLSNAIKFNQPGGQVIVSSALEDSGEVVLRVRDTGVGMSAKDLQAAMEPFRQLHTSRHGGGTGLGLPLTKALVEANRASFRIDSEPNHGTLIEITFPPQRVLAE